MIMLPLDRKYALRMVSTALATSSDVEPWIELAASLEPLFGPMPNLGDSISRGIGRGTAWVATQAGTFVGGMLLSRPGRPQRINWLGVRTEHRGHGAGTALVVTALRQWPTGSIVVTTFAAEEPDGQAARRLYQRHGFVCQGPTDPAPDGSTRDLFQLMR